MAPEDFYIYVLKGNRDAIAFIASINQVLNIRDDLFDGDRGVSQEEIDKAFWLALIDLPRNNFYRANFAELNPLLASAIQNWHAANIFEASDSENDKHIAFITRSCGIDLLIVSALLVGGYDWCREVTPQIRRFAHDETYDGYRANLRKQFDDAAALKGK